MVRSIPMILALGVALIGAAPAAELKRVTTDSKRLALFRQLFVPEVYLRAVDRDRARLLRDGYVALPPCEFVVTELGGDAYASLPTDQCYKMTEPERMRGFWNDEFEASQFCTAPEKCFYPNSETWLEFADPKMQRREPTGTLYAVEFIGRRPLYSGSFGHFGMFTNDVIVDRMISMKEIQPPPRG